MADQPVSPVPVAPAGLSRRAQRFIETEGIRVRRQDIRRHHDAWIEHGIPAAEIERATAFQDRWGGLTLPSAPFYEGGPRILDADCPQRDARRRLVIPGRRLPGVHGLPFHDRPRRCVRHRRLPLDAPACQH
ncbi:hypothetical protein GCM10010274_57170 [Streptomyces lavendofoliae]|uniref:Uncharacterized protein n=1 Tax=Streptomyces lavendofoliae TaxID=67314 RepID=A0A918I2Z1_9ACTN|nr:hypothetical protein GCM10010274_57170 [Streptomyces lavendofoliae]